MRFFANLRYSYSMEHQLSILLLVTADGYFVLSVAQVARNQKMILGRFFKTRFKIMDSLQVFFTADKVRDQFSY